MILFYSLIRACQNEFEQSINRLLKNLLSYAKTDFLRLDT